MPKHDLGAGSSSSSSTIKRMKKTPERQTNILDLPLHLRLLILSFYQKEQPNIPLPFLSKELIEGNERATTTSLHLMYLERRERAMSPNNGVLSALQKHMLRWRIHEGKPSLLYNPDKISLLKKMQLHPVDYEFHLLCIAYLKLMPNDTPLNPLAIMQDLLTVNEPSNFELNLIKLYTPLLSPEELAQVVQSLLDDNTPAKRLLGVLGVLVRSRYLSTTQIELFLPRIFAISKTRQGEADALSLLATLTSRPINIPFDAFMDYFDYSLNQEHPQYRDSHPVILPNIVDHISDEQMQQWLDKIAITLSEPHVHKKWFAMQMLHGMTNAKKAPSIPRLHTLLNSHLALTKDDMLLEARLAHIALLEKLAQDPLQFTHFKASIEQHLQASPERAASAIRAMVNRAMDNGFTQAQIQALFPLFLSCPYNEPENFAKIYAYTFKLVQTLSTQGYKEENQALFSMIMHYLSCDHAPAREVAANMLNMMLPKLTEPQAVKARDFIHACVDNADLKIQRIGIQLIQNVFYHKTVVLLTSPIALLLNFVDNPDPEIRSSVSNFLVRGEIMDHLIDRDIDTLVSKIAPLLLGNATITYGSLGLLNSIAGRLTQTHRDQLIPLLMPLDDIPAIQILSKTLLTHLNDQQIRDIFEKLTTLLDPFVDEYNYWNMLDCLQFMATHMPDLHLRIDWDRFIERLSSPQFGDEALNVIECIPNVLTDALRDQLLGIGLSNLQRHQEADVMPARRCIILILNLRKRLTDPQLQTLVPLLHQCLMLNDGWIKKEACELLYAISHRLTNTQIAEFFPAFLRELPTVFRENVYEGIPALFKRLTEDQINNLLPILAESLQMCPANALISAITTVATQLQANALSLLINSLLNHFCDSALKVIRTLAQSFDSSQRKALFALLITSDKPEINDLRIQLASYADENLLSLLDTFDHVKNYEKKIIRTIYEGHKAALELLDPHQSGNRARFSEIFTPQ